MSKNSIGLVILWWCEVVIALRVLLFSVPVIINKSLAQNFVMSGLNDRFIVVITATALLYFVVGVASIAGYRYWKTIHYLAAIFTLVLTVGSLSVYGQPTDVAGVFYYIPMFVACVFVCMAIVLSTAKRAV